MPNKKYAGGQMFSFFLKSSGLLLILCLSSLLGGCSELAVFIPAGKLTFSIKSEANLVMSDKVSFEWTANPSVKTYEVAVAVDDSCKEYIFQKLEIKEPRVVLDHLADGKYFLCVYALISARRLPAKNNGIPFIIDRTDPWVTIPSQIETHSETFQAQITVDDMTPYTAAWAQVSGPGNVTFADPMAINSAIKADRNGIYQIRATIEDQAGHKVEQLYHFYWNGSLEDERLRFISLNHTGAALDGFVNFAEKNAAGKLWTLNHTLATQIDYTQPLDVSAIDVTCDSTQDYDRTSIASALDLPSDGTYVLCARLSDAEGRIVYGKSESLVRDTLGPSFVSLSPINAALDGVILNDEKFLVNPLWSLTGSDFSRALFSAALDNASNDLVCDATITMDQLQIATPSSLAMDTTYALCARLEDQAGNVTFGKSTSITRDTSIPSVSSFVRVNGASDGFINDAEKGSPLALWSLTQTGSSSVLYTSAFDNSSAVVCSNTQDYSQSTLPVITALTSDGSWAVCVKLTNTSGNSLYIKAPAVIRDTIAPVLISLINANAAVDGVINNSEKLGSQALWALSASGQSSALFTAALSDTAGGLICDQSLSYMASTSPIASSLSTDDEYVVCTLLSDEAGNKTYGKSTSILRDTTGPTISSFLATGDAADGFISSAETGSTLPLYALNQTGATSILYTTVSGDTAGALVCNAARSYDQTSIARATDLAADGAYAICVRLRDSIGNETFGKSAQVVRGTSGPTFGSLTPQLAAADGYINDSEKNLTTAVWSLTQVGSTATSYTTALDDVAGLIACDASQTYSESSIPQINQIASDGTWVVCVKLMDSLGNASYGKSAAVVRDIILPTFTSFANTNAAADGVINASEKLLINDLWTLSASAYTSASFSNALNDLANALTCDGSQTYPLTSPPNPSSLVADGTFAGCVKLVDDAGNIRFGKSSQLVRNTNFPVFTSLLPTNVAADGFVNESEKSSILELAVLTASLQTTTYYSAALDDTAGQLLCDSTQVYGSTTVPLTNSLTSDGTFAICVELKNAAGNKTFGKSSQIVRDTISPQFVSLVGQGDALDSIISNAEKLGTSALWSLTHSGASSIAYTPALDDTGGSLSCDVSQSYSASTVAAATALTSDKAWAICVRLTDSAGNVSYGKSSQVVRNTAGPNFVALALTNAAADGFINDSEKSLLTALWTLNASGQNATAYSEALLDMSGSLVCNASQIYDQAATPTGLSLTVDGQYALCVRLTDASGNINYGKSQLLVRDITHPGITTFASVNEASDGYINAAESSSILPLHALTAAGYSSVEFTLAQSDSGGSLVCDSSRTYGNASIPSIASIGIDGRFAVCAKLSDAAGNITYGKSSQVNRSTVAPSFTSLTNANAAVDSYINASELALSSPLWTLTASGQSTTAYTLPLNDSGGTLVCNSSKTYNQSAVARPLDLTSDGVYGICVKLSDLSGNITYGKSEAVTRDSILPTFTSLVGSNEANDGYVSNSEKTSALALFTLSASGYTAAWYTAVVPDPSGTATCTSARSYNQSTVPAISTLTSDGTYVVCVELTDAAGNKSFGKSQAIIRETVAPVFTSLSNINAASDGFVNDSEKALTSVLWSLSATGATSTAYTAPIDNTSNAAVCDAGATYGQSTIARAADLTSDRPWIICVKLSDAAGNVVFGKSTSIVRDIAPASFGSLAIANAAADGFISDSEKLGIAAMWTLAATGQTSAAYTLPLADLSGTLTCDMSKTYGESSISGPSSLSVDGPYVLCVKLFDAAGNISYGKSASVIRDIIFPSFTSLAAANEAADGFISDAEKNSNLALYTLNASGYSSALYTDGLDDTSAALVCNASKSYLYSTLPSISSLAADGPKALCVALSDSAGNILYAKSAQVIRTTSGPNLTSFIAANAGADGYINDAEKSLTTALWTMTQTGATTVNYTAALNDNSGTVLCDASKSYSSGTIARAQDLTSDGSWVICVKLEDAGGNITYGKSATIVRDILLPSLTSLSLANAASDGFINDAEKNLTSTLWTLSASGYSSAMYTAVASDTSGTIICDASKTYGQATIARPSDMSVDGAYAICVKLSDAAGNVSYGKSVQATRDITLPLFTSLVRANEASDGYINNSEKNSALPLYTLTASGYSAAMFTAALNDSSSALTCDISRSYSNSSVPTPASMSSDGIYAVCVLLTDDAGNKSYGKSNQVTRAITGPTFTSLARANAASDGYVNDSEKLLVSTLWTLTASGQTATAYTLASSDTSGSLVCDAARSYTETSIATPSSLASDGLYALCVRLTDASGNITYGKSAQITRDVTAPLFTSLARANEAGDGYINNSEKGSTLALYTLTASGQTSTLFTVASNDSASALVCDNAKTYSSGSIPIISALTSDGTFAVCVSLTDAAGNTTYGKSAQVVRATTAPIFTSLALANAAADSYINNSEKLLTAPLWTLNASGQTSTAYTLASLDTGGTLACDSGQTYGELTLPRPSDITADGAYALCVKLSDAGGNITYGKSAQLTRDILAPTFTSLVAANEANDGYVSNSEKTSAQPLYTLTATGHSTAFYTAAASDSPSALVCDVNITFGSSSIPLINSLAADGTFAACVQLTDAAGNISYGKSAQVVRDTAAPTFTSLVGINAASDGYVNDSEKALTTALWSLTQTGASIIAFTSALDDTSNQVVCDVNRIYGQSTLARPADLASDRPWALCVQLKDAAGNIAYGKSTQVIRDTAAPTFTSLARANAAIDGYISDSEKLLSSPMWTLSASGQTATAYTVVSSDAGPLVCDASKTYGQSTIGVPSDISADGVYAICVKLTDVSGNIIYRKSASVTRDIVAPTLSSLAGANEAADGYINNAEKASTLAIYSLTASNYSSAAYSTVLSDAGSVLVCDSNKTYANASMPKISNITSDGTYAICVELKDAAGNTIYGKSTQVIRATSAPVFTSLARANDGSDGYINNGEKLLGSSLWTLTASAYTSAAYTLASNDSGNALVCDTNRTYAQSSIPIVSDLTTDGTFAICVRLQDASGNITFGKSAQIIRDIVPPTFTSLVGANGAADGFVTDGDKNSALALFALVASGQDTTIYTLPLNDTSSAVVCDSGKTYGQSAIPTIASLTPDGTYALCVKLADLAGNAVYGKSAQIIRDTVAPTFTSLNGINAGSDGYVNDAEKGQSTALWLLTQSGAVTIRYTLALDDTGSSVSCDSSKAYGQTIVPVATNLGSDRPWAICVSLADASGNITYGKSSQITRDIIAPTFTSLALSGSASDGFINDSEKLLVNAMWTLTAAGQSVTDYTLALADAGGTLACNATQTYNQSSIATPSGISSDGTYVECVRLSDAAGNLTYGKSVSLVRDATAPLFTSLADANEASDGYVNNSEKTSNLALYTLAASGQSASKFTSTLSDAPTAVPCNSSQTYGGSSIPVISSLIADGSYAICVELIDLAGNKTYGKSDRVVRDTSPPTFTSLALANAATDAYINDSEKALTTALWTLTAAGQTTTQYTQALSDTSAALVCDISKTYGQSTIALASSLTTDGAYSLCVKLSDDAGNIVYGKAAQLVRDILVPSATSISINGGATSTSSTNVTLSLAATDTLARQMYVTNTSGCGSGGSWENFAATKSWTLGQASGTATVYVRYRDAALNQSACISSTIMSTGPAPTGTSVTINSNAPTVPGDAVTLTLAATGASEVYITNVAGCASGGTWSSYATSKSWILSLGTSTTATAYVKFRSASLTESACISDAIDVAEINLLSNGGFETGSLTSWTPSASNWAVTNTNVNAGIYSAQSLSPPDGALSCISQTVNIADSVSAFRLSYNLAYLTESCCDSATVSIDNVQKEKYSGSSDWLTRSTPIQGGASRNVKFCYTKDGSVAPTGDFVRLDEVRLSSPLTLAFQAVQTLALNQKIRLDMVSSSSSSELKTLIVRSTSPVSFIPVNGTSYVLGAQGSDQIVYNGPLRTFTDSGLINGTTYYYSVFNVSATNNYSLASKTIAVPELLHRPTSVTVSTASPTQYNLAWTVEVGGTQTAYLLVYRNGSAPTFVPSQGTPYSPGSVTGGTILQNANALSYSHSGRTAGQTEYYQIWAVGAGNSYSLYGTSATYSGCSGLVKHGSCFFLSEVSADCNTTCSAKGMSFHTGLYDTILSDSQTGHAVCNDIATGLGIVLAAGGGIVGENALACELNVGGSYMNYIVGGPSSGTYKWDTYKQACPCR
jgi:hypothetical protein